MRAASTGERVAMVLVVVALVSILLFQPGTAMEKKSVMPLVVNQSFNVPEGLVLDVTAMRGKVLLIDFWATWCQPCVQSIPHLRKLHQDYADQGLIIIGYTDSSSKNLETFIASHQIPYIIAVGPSAADYQVRSIPQIVVVDKNGLIRIVGHPMDLKSAHIERLLAE